MKFKNSILLLAALSSGCASVFDTPRPVYNAEKVTCSAQDMQAMLVTVGRCQKAGYSGAVCFDVAVVKHCGSGKKHKLFTGGIEA
jgi:hypothetical protein